MNTPVKLPFYAKASLFIIGVYFFVSILSVGKDILLPLIYATILAIAISPVINYLVRKSINRIVAIAAVFVVAVLIVTSLIALLSLQADSFSESVPELADKFQLLLNQIVSWASGYFNIRTRSINVWIANSKLELLGHGSEAIGSALSITGFLLEATTLTVVYICMILYYQSHLTAFVHRLFSANHDSKVSEILTQTKSIIKAYLAGLFAELVIIAMLNTVGLFILGIDYAIVLGLIGGLLNIIPFIGGISGVILYMAIALLTKTPIYVLYVVILHTIIQFIDNHYIVPKIIGSKVKLNAHVALVAVVLGAALWGVAGMFLSIPLTAIIKLLCDRIDSLNTWGFLLGDESSAPTKIKSSITVKGFISRWTVKK